MEEKKFNLEFTFVELNLLLKACRRLPYEEVIGIINNITTQYTTIQTERELAAKKDKK